MAGKGVAELVPRMLPLGAAADGAKLGLPRLPVLAVLLNSKVKAGPPA